MTLKAKLQQAWDNRHQIAEGLYNTFLSHDVDIRVEALRRKGICESNVCGWYDPTGKPETSAIPGKPACSKCHCNTELKVHCMSCYCPMGDLHVPGDRLCMDKALWDQLITPEMDKDINQRAWENQFKPKQ